MGIVGKIHVQRYLAEKPKGVIIISHGFTEAAPKYDEMIYYFLKAGYHVYMPEHMGHGQSYRLTADSSLVHIDCYCTDEVPFGKGGRLCGWSEAL